ncbi:MAG: S9 family peptidase [Longimicrobiales bacterium]
MWGLRTRVSALLPAFALAALLCAPPLAAQAGPVTLEGLMSAPFPSGLTAAPSGGWLAWVQNDRGARNIWVAGPPEYRGRPITAYTRDDGQEIGSLTWSTDGATLVFVRGGTPNRQGEVPNPASDPAGMERALWRIARDGGDPVRVGPGSGPAMAPDGSGVAYVQGGQIWFAPLPAPGAGASGTPAPVLPAPAGQAAQSVPSVLIRARGGLGSLAWSPDASRLAFVSNRGTHAFVGVWEKATRSLRWIDPSVDVDGSPVWSPSGDRIAFTRTPSSVHWTMFAPVREAPPWSIRIADPRTGSSTELWKADEGPGSVPQGVSGAGLLLWGAGDRIVFPWEKTGWRLLWSISASGGAATLLTPGNFEVEYVALSPDRRTVWFNSNEDDIDRRDLWKVSVSQGPPTAVMRTTDIEWEPLPLAAGDDPPLAFLASGARAPAHAMIRLGGQVRDLVPGGVPSSFPTDRLVEPQPVVVTATDGMKIHAQLFLPADLRAGEKRPAVIFFHGGSRRQMVLGFHYSSYYHNAYSMHQHMASRGYVVLQVNYRSGTGYGLDFREALDYGATGGSEFNDVMGAGLYLASRPDVDPERIGLWGGSYGGYLTAMGLSRASDLFAAGVDIHGVHDWNVGIATFRPEYNPLEDPERTRTAFQASPMSTVDGWRSPVLVVHGDDDRNVRFVETVALVEELRERDVHVEQLVFPDEVHSFLLHANWLSAYRAAADFFDRMLKPGGAGAARR